MRSQRWIALAALALAAPLLSAATAHASVDAGVSGDTADSVLAWNRVAVSTVLASGQFQAQGMTHLAYVQASVLDAVVSVEHRGDPYVGRLRAPAGTSLDAAVATAAHDILALQYPLQASVYDPPYAAALASVADTAARDAGVAVGHAAASQLLSARAGDGLEANVPYTFGSGPGVWTLPDGTPATTPQTPWVGAMRPFLIGSAGQFLPGPPPPLSSDDYARDLRETAAFGSATSTVRTAEQTQVALFWSANINTVYNATMRSVVAAQGMGPVEAARALALVDLVGADSLIACMNAKYHYSFWRPFMAIRNADVDGNPATTADPAWVPLLPTPNHPEYPAAHGCITAAEADVLSDILGTRQIEVNIASPVTGTTRHFATVAQLDSEVVDARVWGGVHFRNSVRVGVQLGREVADLALEQFGDGRDGHDDGGDRAG